MRRALLLSVALSALLGPSVASAADATPDCGGRGQGKCEFKPAIRVGKAQNIGCPKDTFPDPIRGGECWSCPKRYMRTGTHIDDGQACAMNFVSGPWTSATYHRSVWGCNNKKGEVFDPVDGGQCYKCPAHYNRSAHHVKRPTACTVRAELTCDGGLTLLDEICAPPVNPAEKARVLREYPAAAKKYEGLHASMAKGLRETHAQMEPADRNSTRRKLMRDQLDKAKDYGFDIVTLMGSASGAVVVGYGHARGFAMTLDGQCHEVFGNSITAGVSVGFSGIEEIGLWKGGIDGLAGEDNGIQASFSLLMLTFTKGIHWSVGATAPTGITTGTGGGGGLDLSAEYVHGWTKLRCIVDCATLDWDDTPLLDSDASCNRKE